MSFSTLFHLISGSRDRRGYDYHMYTCMKPDSAQFHNMARIRKFLGEETNHKIWCCYTPHFSPALRRALTIKSISAWFL